MRISEFTSDNIIINYSVVLAYGLCLYFQNQLRPHVYKISRLTIFNIVKRFLTRLKF